MPINITTMPPGFRAAQKAAAYKNWASHPDVLKFVEDAAEVMKTQKTIAAALGKNASTFEMALAGNKGDNPLRLAFELGRAKAEQKHIDVANALSPKNAKEMVAWIFFMKAQFGWKDRPDIISTDAPKIQFILPGPMTDQEYYKKLGIEGPIDTRPPEQRNVLGSMKDVTPGADGKMPTKITPGSHKLDGGALAALAPLAAAVMGPPAEDKAAFVPNIGQKNSGDK